jgi:hypothetical protein
MVELSKSLRSSTGDTEGEAPTEPSSGDMRLSRSFALPSTLQATRLGSDQRLNIGDCAAKFHNYFWPRSWAKRYGEMELRDVSGSPRVGAK